MKREKRKISMVTAYDYWSARLINMSDINCILVGDSLAMVMHGHKTTIQATPSMMATHIEMVAKGAPDKFIIGDMPFLSFRKGREYALDTVQQLIQAGAHAVKLEEVTGHEEIIEHIINSGVPVMGHLGLTPQSIHQLGGYKVQAKDAEAQKILFNKAKTLHKLGCFSLVLECVPSDIADCITKELPIPVIGIGAGANVDGQVLVLHDMLGLNNTFSPKFIRQYLNGEDLIINACNQFDQDCKNMSFPGPKESY